MEYRSVLLIDDDNDDHEIFATAAKLVSPSLVCLSMVDATEALRRLLSKELQPDIIFLDLNMPVMSGQQFLLEMRKYPELDHIPVIIYSTTSNTATIRMMKESGAHDFITKPGRFDVLIELLKPILG